MGSLGSIYLQMEDYSVEKIGYGLRCLLLHVPEKYHDQVRSAISELERTQDGEFGIVITHSLRQDYILYEARRYYDEFEAVLDKLVYSDCYFETQDKQRIRPENFIQKFRYDKRRNFARKNYWNRIRSRLF